MGLLDKIKNVFGVGNDAAVEDEFTNIITSTLNEYRSKNKFFWSYRYYILLIQMKKLKQKN